MQSLKQINMALVSSQQLVIKIFLENVCISCNMFRLLTLNSFSELKELMPYFK